MRTVLKLMTSNKNLNVNQVLNRFRKEAPVYLESFKAANKDIVYQKITNLNNWYTKILGLDEVKLYQERVVNLQQRLLDAQDKRREIGRVLAEVRKKSNQLQDEIHKVKRQDDIERFLNLMKEETELLRHENEIARTFQELDQTERDLFSAFTNAVRDSHEKQRSQLEYTKYFGIILSIAGSFLAFCYTSIKKNDLKYFIEESLARKLNDKGISNVDTNVLEFVQNETMKLSKKMDLSHKEVIYLLAEELQKKKYEQQTFYDITYWVGAICLGMLIIRTFT